MAGRGDSGGSHRGASAARGRLSSYAQSSSGRRQGADTDGADALIRDSQGRLKRRFDLLAALAAANVKRCLHRLAAFNVVNDRLTVAAPEADCAIRANGIAGAVAAARHAVCALDCNAAASDSPADPGSSSPSGGSCVCASGRKRRRRARPSRICSIPQGVDADVAAAAYAVDARSGGVQQHIAKEREHVVDCKVGLVADVVVD